ncbi:hypothetical protein RRG08_010893 [Elysia crispata]|uniref:Uncharacterized protein n=1 Tax=Elysia crispata TaxID=231223 RepID=A0AAE1A0Z1_9GAST|nr:hypothetical protein RRG08_010893 [Elysia crispata]
MTIRRASSLPVSLDQLDHPRSSLAAKELRFESLYTSVVHVYDDPTVFMIGNLHSARMPSVTGRARCALPLNVWGKNKNIALPNLNTFRVIGLPDVAKSNVRKKFTVSEAPVQPSNQLPVEYTVRLKTEDWYSYTSSSCTRTWHEMMYQV